MKMRIFIFAILALMLGVSSNRLRADEVQFASTTDASYIQRLEAIEAELSELRESGGGGGFDCDCSNTPGLIGGIELSLLMPHPGSLRLAVTPPGGQFVLTPNYDVQAAPRVWLGYRNSEGLGVRARYWQLNATAVSTSLPVPLISSVEAQAFDFEVTQTAKLGRWELDVSGGIRWGLVENGLDVGPGILSLFQNMEGTGPTIAIGARRPVGCRNLSIYGNARASLLFGDNDFTASGFLLGPFLGGSSLTLSAENSVMQVYEMQIGTEWTKELSNGGQFFARAGLEAQVWDVPGATLGLLDQNIGFVGGVLAFGINR